MVTVVTREDDQGRQLAAMGIMIGFYQAAIRSIREVSVNPLYDNEAMRLITSACDRALEFDLLKENLDVRE